MILEYIKTSLLMIKVKPVRSILSLLGIYIGVLALLVILSIREGVEYELQNLFRTEGAKVIYVHAGFDQETRRIGQLTFDDSKRLRSLDGILSVLPRLTGSKDARSEFASKRVDLVGIDEAFFPVYRIPFKSGRNFLKDEVRYQEPVCVVTEETARHFFPYDSALGKTISIENQRLTIQGIVKWDATMATRSMSNDPEVFVPYGWLVTDETSMIPMLEVRVRPDRTAKEAVAFVTGAISNQDPIRAKQYFVRSIEQYAEKRQEAQDRISRSLLGIAAVSLIVGGIGIANVMLTSVTERIREIGLRKALGARRKDILLQFLVEACALAGTGGILAVLTAYIGVSVYPIFAAKPTALLLSPIAAVACFLLTVFVGFVAGGYPASHAAGLSPAEALRYE